MGFNLKKAVGTVFPTSGIGLLDSLKPNSVTQDQVALETPEQKAARKMLLDFSKTGKFGNFTAGADVGLGYGDFNATAAENEGLSELQKLLSSGIPEQFQLGNNALKDILNPDPAFVASQFDPFKVQVERQTRDAVDEARRTAGYMGNLYSTDTVKRLGDVQARGNETLTSQLAELTNAALNRRLQAVPLAFQSAKDEEGTRLNRINASQQYGGLTRMLNDASIKSRDAELLRRRQELLQPIQAASSVAGQNANFGVPSVTTQTPSQTMELLNLLVKGGSAFAGARGGA